MRLHTNITLSDLKAVEQTIEFMEQIGDLNDTDGGENSACTIHLSVISAKIALRESLNKYSSNDPILQKSVIFYISDDDETLDLLIDEEGFDATRHNQEAQTLFMRYLRSVEKKTDTVIIDGDGLISLIELRDALNSVDLNKALGFDDNFKFRLEHPNIDNPEACLISPTSSTSSLGKICSCLASPLLFLIYLPIKLALCCCGSSSTEETDVEFSLT